MNAADLQKKLDERKLPCILFPNTSFMSYHRVVWWDRILILCKYVQNRNDRAWHFRFVNHSKRSHTANKDANETILCTFSIESHFFQGIACSYVRSSYVVMCVFIFPPVTECGLCVVVFGFDSASRGSILIETYEVDILRYFPVAFRGRRCHLHVDPSPTQRTWNSIIPSPIHVVLNREFLVADMNANNLQKLLGCEGYCCAAAWLIPMFWRFEFLISVGAPFLVSACCCETVYSNLLCRTRSVSMKSPDDIFEESRNYDIFPRKNAAAKCTCITQHRFDAFMKINDNEWWRPFIICWSTRLAVTANCIQREIAPT